MLKYVGGRILQAVFVVVAAYAIAFLILYGIGGDPIAGLYSGGDAGHLSDEMLDALRVRFGLDQPLIVQFFTRLAGMATGDFGVSLKDGRAVADLLLPAVPYTAGLVVLALVMAILLGGAIALAATWTRLNWLRQSLLALPSFGVSMPTFWTGLVLMQIFAFQLRWVPPLGSSGFSSMILPALTMAIPGVAAIAQVFAKSLFAVQAEPYITTARAAGVRPIVIHLRDTLRNALIPTVTVLGIMVSNLFGATIVVENVFARQGLGQLIGQAVLGRDIPIVLAVVVVGAFVFAATTLIVDLLYPVMDPRLRIVRNA